MGIRIAGFWEVARLEKKDGSWWVLAADQAPLALMACLKASSSVGIRNRLVDWS